MNYYGNGMYGNGMYGNGMYGNGMYGNGMYSPTTIQTNLFRVTSTSRPRFTGTGRSTGVSSRPRGTPFSISIADGYGSAASAANVFHVPLTVELPGASGIRLERGLELTVSTLVRAESNDDQHTFLVLQMPRLAVNQICGCYVELTGWTWKRQGSGDRKSRVGLKGLGDFTLHTTDRTTHALDVPLCFGDRLKGLKGDTVGLKFYYVVGGGDLEIRVEKLLVRLFTYEGLARATLNYLFTFRAIAAAPATAGALFGPRFRRYRRGGQGEYVVLSLATLLPKDVQCVVLSYLEIPLEYLLFDTSRVRAASKDGRLPPEIVPFSMLYGRYTPQIADPASFSSQRTAYALPAEDKGCCVAQ